MKNIYLAKNYLVAAVVKVKFEIFKNKFLDQFELDYFQQKIVEKLNEEGLSVVITTMFDSDAFENVGDGVIRATNIYYLNSLLSNEKYLMHLNPRVYEILNDKDFIVELLIDYKEKEIQTLKSKLEENTNKVLQKKL